MFRANLVVHHQEHGIIYCIIQYNWYNRYNRVGESSCSKQLDSPDSTIVPTVLCNTLYYAVLLLMNEGIRSKRVEQTKKKLWNKIDYKNCASRWFINTLQICQYLLISSPMFSFSCPNVPNFRAHLGFQVSPKVVVGHKVVRRSGWPGNVTMKHNEASGKQGSQTLH